MGRVLYLELYIYVYVVYICIYSVKDVDAHPRISTLLH